MRRMICLYWCLLYALGLLPDAVAARNWECDELVDYPDLVAGEFPDDPRGYDLVVTFVETDDPFDTMRRHELRYLSDVLYEWGDNLDDVRTSRIPRAAREMHDVLIDQIYALGDIAYDVTEGKDLLAAMWDADIDKIYWAHERADKLGLERCGDDWTAIFDSADEDSEDDDPIDLDKNFLFHLGNESRKMDPGHEG